MDFDDMNELQRRLHNAAIVAECDGDEYGHAGLMREAIAEIESQRQAIDAVQRELCGDTWMGEPVVPN